MVDFYKFDIASAVTDSLIDMFDMMLSMKLLLGEDKDITEKDGGRIVGSVSMVGKVKGSITIGVSDEFSKIMTAAMLGGEIDEIEGGEDIMDVISEACNIVGGNLKAKFCDAGLTCRLSPPAFTSGNDFSIESLNTHRKERYVFKYQQYCIIVEVGVGINEAADEEEDDKEQEPQPIKPIDVEKFKQFDIQPVLSNAMSELFDMMLSMELEFKGQDTSARLEGDKIVGSVCFAGSLRGSINIYIGQAFSRQMAAAMLGIEVDELEGDDEVKDVISEVCNIVGGNLKSKFCDSDFICEISTPSYTSGSDFIIESKDLMRYERYVFHHEDERIIIELGLTVDEGAMPEDASDAPEEGSAESKLSQDDIDNITSEYFNDGDQQRAVDSFIAVQNDKPKAPPKHDKPSGPGRTSDKPREPMTGKDSVERPVEKERGNRNLDMVLDIPVEIVVEMGRTSISIENLLKICNGSVVEFSNLAAEPVELFINKKLVAKGKIVVEDEKYGIRITEAMTSLNERAYP